MATIASKCKLNIKPIKDKYSALKEVEYGKTKSQFVAEYGIPKNTLSSRLTNKDNFRSHEERKQLKTPVIESGHFCKLGSNDV